MGSINTTVQRMKDGVTAVTATAKTIRFSVLGAWLAAETYTVTIVNPVSGKIVTIGSGTATGLSPTFLFTYKKKLNALCGTDWLISAIDSPTVFNDLNAPGRGKIELDNYFAAPSAALAIGPYQGKLIPVGKESSQVWSVAAAVESYNNDQVLDNTGTIAKLSAQAWGELDFYFLDETGVRSFRARETSLNAVLNDIGSPLDIAIQTKLASCSVTQKAAACGIVDPTSGRYFLFIKDTIYVLSNFPASGIQAWARYDATYQATDYLRYKNSVGGPYVVKVSMVNDVTKAFFTSALVDEGVYIDIVPGNYIFTYNPETETVIDSSAITNGVLFRGSIWNSLIGAWSFTSNQTAFVPEKFLTHKKQVFARSATALFAYGGLTGNDYDNAVASAKIPWLDIGKGRISEGLNASMTGAWYVYASMDYLTTQFTQVLAAQSSPTYDGGLIPFSSNGSHFSMQVVSNAASRALMSALTFNFK